MLKKRLKKLGKLIKIENEFLNTHSRLLIRLMGLALIVCLVLSLNTSIYLKPVNPEDFAKTAVKIVRMDERSGGSGVILSSSESESIVLTNKHVCRVVEHGGLVIQDDARHFVVEYKLSELHDMCLIKVNANLHVNTKIAEHSPKNFTKAYISGHPALLPHVLTEGNFSKKMIIDVMIGMRECTPEELAKFGLQCVLEGGMPIINTYEAQLVTGTIMPGSSGSAVFTAKGEVAGLVFAGQGGNGLSYAFIVPQEYIRRFLNEEAASLDWKKPATMRSAAE